MLNLVEITDQKANIANIVAVKRIAKIVCGEIERTNATMLDVSRKKRKLIGENSPFDKHRIALLAEQVDAARAHITECRAALAYVGEWLADYGDCSTANLSFHDKCQLLGRSHVAVRNSVEDAENQPFNQLIFVHVAEAQVDYDFFPNVSIQMPLWSAYRAHFCNMLQTNDEAREIASNFFNEMMLAQVKTKQPHLKVVGRG